VSDRAGARASISLADLAPDRPAYRLLEDYVRALDVRATLRDPDGRVVESIPMDEPSVGADDGIEREVRAYDDTIGSLRVDGPDYLICEKAADRIAAFLGEQIGWNFERESLTEEIVDSYEGISCFYDIAASIGAARDVHDVCDVVLQKADTLIPSRRASILLLDEAAGELYVGASIGHDRSVRRASRIKAGEGLSGQVLRTRTPELVEDVGALPPGVLRGSERHTSRSFLSVPLVVHADEGTRSIGVLNLADKLVRRGGRSSEPVTTSYDIFRSKDTKLLLALADQAAVLIDNLRLIGFEKEMGIARTIQQSLLPTEPPAAPGVQLVGRCVTARKVGGDYFDYFAVDDERIGIAIADVSGHDVASALMMAVARSSLRADIARHGSPGPALAASNRSLIDDLERTELFISGFLAIYDHRHRTLQFASAGHNPPLLLRGATGRVDELQTNGLLLGILRDEEYEESQTSLREGDVLLLYTDGIIEANAPDGRPFGTALLRETLQEEGSRPAHAILEAVLRAVRDHGGGRPMADDVTAVVMKITAPPGTAEERQGA